MRRFSSIAALHICFLRRCSRRRSTAARKLRCRIRLRLRLKRRRQVKLGSV